MKNLLLIILLLVSFVKIDAQQIAVKNNLVYDLTLTPNLGLEFKLNKKFTLDILGGYNPFTFNDDKRFKHWLVQPELRYWFCESFNGTYMGLHAHGGEFSVAGLDLPFGMFPTLKDHRYEGYYVGGGVSIGHHWILSKRWSIEANIGAGYAYVDYDKYGCKTCSPKLKSGSRNYIGVTKIGVSFIYFIY
ncbi:MAG: DUF3575 domain-containing protein [Dysgonomonas sp.]